MSVSAQNTNFPGQGDAQHRTELLGKVHGSNAHGRRAQTCTGAGEGQGGDPAAGKRSVSSPALFTLY